MIQRAFRYRLYPTPEQAKLMEATANARRFLWNLALEQREGFWRQARRLGTPLTYVRQAHELTLLRAEFDWLRAVHVTPLQQSLRDLEKAFSKFFRGGGHPRYQGRDRNMSFRHVGREVRVQTISAKWALIHVPKIGMVRLRLSRAWRGKLVNVTFARDPLGWHASLACEIEHEVPGNDLPAIGIDRGVATTLSLSNGEMVSTPNLQRLDRRKRRAQRVLARRQRGSNRYLKQRSRLSRISAKIARARSDWQHRASTDIARRFGTVVLEDLKTKNMTRAGAGKRGLNRSILEQGWYDFETKLAYKLEERGGALIKVNPAYTSQTCAVCGVIDKASRESQSRFACRHCGNIEHADVNAARVILGRSTAFVEDAGYGSVEASTSHVLAA